MTGSVIAIIVRDGYGRVESDYDCNNGYGSFDSYKSCHFDISFLKCEKNPIPNTFKLCLVKILRKSNPLPGHSPNFLNPKLL